MNSHKQIVAVMAVAVCLTCTTGWGYDPPEILLRIEGSEATHHCCIGDQNQDGYDDWAVGGNIYYGAEEMSPEPGFTIEGNTRFPRFIGRFLDGYPDLLIAQQNRGWRLIELGDTCMGRIYYDRQVEVVNNAVREHVLSGGEYSHPVDFNGDDYNDLLIEWHALLADSIEYNRLQIHFGGADFDTIPDWWISRPVPRGYSTAFWRVPCGCDVNGDNYSDMLVHYVEEDWDSMWFAHVYELYLGGEPMDTIPALAWNEFQFDPWVLGDEFALLPDVNGDGYDDWGQYNHHSTDFIDEDRFLIFFGGEDLDVEPDVVLSGYPLPSFNGELIGGDFNGDGLGDILTANITAGWGENGAFRFYFGRENWEREPQSDAEFSRQEYGDDYSGGRNLGSVGDYNCDGSDDFIWLSWSELKIYAGYPNNGFVRPNEALPEAHIISTEIRPNPFNKELTLDISLKVDAAVTADVYDVSGRHLARLHTGNLESGTHSFRWASECSGLFIVRIAGGSQTVYHKAVCLK
jgi:hypothetical protein